ncbi:MAG TPA: hypothetical protein VGX68_09440 [Thermoanaerobaculia bacterium]|nr:hypothetical protein [Thermoanaerobaculia bacterium]
MEETHPEPTVTFDAENMTVTLKVVVFLPEGAEDIVIETAPAAIPHGNWTFVWVLDVSTSGLIAEFADPGIILGSLPPLVRVLKAPSGTAETWTAQLRNEVQSANAFNYDIAVDWHLLEDNVIRNVTIHDPTIAVTTDPIGG